MLPFIIAKCQVINKSTGFQQESLRFTGKLNESENKIYIMNFPLHSAIYEDDRALLINSWPQ